MFLFRLPDWFPRLPAFFASLLVGTVFGFIMISSDDTQPTLSDQPHDELAEYHIGPRCGIPDSHPARASSWRTPSCSLFEPKPPRPPSRLPAPPSRTPVANQHQGVRPYYQKYVPLPKGQSPDSVRLVRSQSPLPVSAKKVNGRYVCSKKSDIGRKSQNNKRAHIDRQCCLDPDEVPNPHCTY